MTAQEFIKQLSKKIQESEIPTGNTYIIEMHELTKEVKDYLSLFDNIMKDTWEIVGNTVILKYIEENGTLAVSDMKELIDTSRKYTVPLLEHFDQIKLTKRIDNHRVLL